MANRVESRQSSATCRARDNPLSVQRVLAIRFEPQSLTWAELLARLKALDYRAAIVGPEGSGKTTLLEDLAAPLAARGFRPLPLRLDRSQRRFSRETWARLSSELSSRDVILLDGAEQLGNFAWWRFRRCARRAAGLIVTSHHEGLLPTAIRTTTSPELLERISSRLLGENPSWLTEASRTLFARHRGNLRDALRELYDWYAEGGAATPTAPCASLESGRPGAGCGGSSA
jgi:hypothetical protein